MSGNVTELQLKNKIKGLLFGYTEYGNFGEATLIQKCEQRLLLLDTLTKYYEKEMEQLLTEKDPF
jgi:hypothetical protein|tara:strand:+ start:2058 stop:2252 length:195 start_codon:yes stop_codon:yes gene_type:complete